MTNPSTLTNDYFYCPPYKCHIFPKIEGTRICLLRQEIAKKPIVYGHVFNNPGNKRIIKPNVEHCKTCEIGKQIRMEWE